MTYSTVTKSSKFAASW